MDDLKDSINAHGHIVTNIWNVKQRGTKKPLPMFYVEIKPDSNNKQIYNIKHLLQCKINFEPPHQKREIPQYANCQRYGHTRSFCYRKSRCVKCAGDHSTSNCTRRERSANVKCVLCEGNHPANYKGCTVYKELQKSTFPTLRKKVPPTKPISTRSKLNLTITKGTRPDIHYAQVVRNQPQPDKSQSHSENTMTYTKMTQNNNDILDLKLMMKELMEKISSLLNLITSLVAKMP